MRTPAKAGPKSVSNPALKLAMDTLCRQGTGAAEQLFLRALERARFLAPVAAEPADHPEGPEGQTAVKGNTGVRFRAILTREETPIYPAFTDWQELCRWSGKGGAPTVTATLEDYANLLLEREDAAQGVVINPCHENIVVSKTMLAAWRGGAAPYAMERDREILLRDPEQYPTEMTQAIAGYLSGQSGVKAAWLRQMECGGEKKLLLVVDVTHGDHRRLFNGIAGAAKPYLKGLLLAPVALEDAFSYSAVKDIAPFYQE